MRRSAELKKGAGKLRDSVRSIASGGWIGELESDPDLRSALAISKELGEQLLTRILHDNVVSR